MQFSRVRGNAEEIVRVLRGVQKVRNLNAQKCKLRLLKSKVFVRLKKSEKFFFSEEEAEVKFDFLLSNLETITKGSNFQAGVAFVRCINMTKLETFGNPSH